LGSFQSPRLASKGKNKSTERATNTKGVFVWISGRSDGKSVDFQETILMVVRLLVNV